MGVSAEKYENISGWMLVFLNSFERYFDVSQRDLDLVKQLWSEPTLTYAQCGEKFALSGTSVRRIESGMLSRIGRTMGWLHRRELFGQNEEFPRLGVYKNKNAHAGYEGMPGSQRVV